MKSNWTVPKVTKYDDLSKAWFVWFRFNGKLIKYKKGINYIKDSKLREKEANALCEALHRKLKEGWNPTIDFIEVLNPDITLIAACNLGMERKREVLAKRTAESYETATKYFIQSITVLRLHYLMLTDTKRSHIKIILERAKKIRGWSNQAYNKNMGYLRAIFSELEDMELIEVNPFAKIKTLKVMKREPRRTATDEEVLRIKGCLLGKFPNFWNYCATIYYTGIRPNELFQVKLSMLDLDNYVLKLPPEDTKTSIYRNIFLPEQLVQIFREMELNDLPQDYYLFGSYRQFKNMSIMPGTDFTAGPIKLTRDCGSDLWHKLIKTGLGINVDMYAFKHLGGDKKILAGIELDAIREQFGHTNSRMTLTYVNALKEINKNQIIKMSPSI